MPSKGFQQDAGIAPANYTPDPADDLLPSHLTGIDDALGVLQILSPTLDEKNALAGIGGTPPSAGNPYATAADLSAGGGDFVGPAGAVSGNLVGFADGTGKLGVDSGVGAAAVSANLPTSDEKGALAGTGTPTALNPYVTDDDSRLGGGGATLLYADDFDNPNNADWIVPALAPVEVDPTNNALSVRKFVNGTEKGIGFTVRVPTGSTKLDLTLLSRAKVGEAGVRTVGLKLYFRKIPEGSAVSATWTGGDDGSKVLDDLSLPATTAFRQRDVLTTLVLVDEGIIPGQTYQFEFTRIAPGAGTELGGDWYLQEFSRKFS